MLHVHEFPPFGPTAVFLPSLAAVWMRRLSYRQHIEFVDANGKPAADLAAAVRAKALEKV
ncbi:MAG: hypothetical protein LKI94_08420 [Sporolactobacillus sp.]|jgi:hypothetical protein|nr:hypothetical protein [Sporolactobacillus sp.]